MCREGRPNGRSAERKGCLRRLAAMSAHPVPPECPQQGNPGLGEILPPALQASLKVAPMTCLHRQLVAKPLSALAYAGILLQSSLSAYCSLVSWKRRLHMGGRAGVEPFAFAGSAGRIPAGPWACQQRCHPLGRAAGAALGQSGYPARQSRPRAAPARWTSVGAELHARPSQPGAYPEACWVHCVQSGPFLARCTCKSGRLAAAIFIRI